MQRDGKNLEEEPIHIQQKYFFSEIYIKKKKKRKKTCRMHQHRKQVGQFPHGFFLHKMGRDSTLYTHSEPMIK